MGHRSPLRRTRTGRAGLILGAALFTGLMLGSPPGVRAAELSEVLASVTARLAPGETVTAVDPGALYVAARSLTLERAVSDPGAVALLGTLASRTRPDPAGRDAVLAGVRAGLDDLARGGRLAPTAQSDLLTRTMVNAGLPAPAPGPSPAARPMLPDPPLPVIGAPKAPPSPVPQAFDRSTPLPPRPPMPLAPPSAHPPAPPSGTPDGFPFRYPMAYPQPQTQPHPQRQVQPQIQPAQPFPYPTPPGYSPPYIAAPATLPPGYPQQAYPQQAAPQPAYPQHVTPPSAYPQPPTAPPGYPNAAPLPPGYAGAPYGPTPTPWIGPESTGVPAPRSLGADPGIMDLPDLVRSPPAVLADSGF
ncbi:hypothetical protein F1188_13820 [Roseospira marina]|uniref:Uncharacterized protein n=1 Tax=Roseospira marina TaxID=140057 RepID=A0A5M6IAX1_9PROT|nr:hypothetical protein [Roseospira marina]KAA5604895.1 hypothetical protein F1188_13820 [Roseospira marina]MBB4315234.1 hypothetical protein [Roseospira marina]MBB5088234.1 hypothetical protein [Roseospira marina]